MKSINLASTLFTTLLFYLAIPSVLAANEAYINLQTSSTVGAAPLSVHFDASEVVLNQVVLDPIKEVHYHWYFNDDKEETWSTNDQSKDQDEGFITAHLFEKPGQFLITLTVSSPTGAFSTVTKNIDIQVKDPNDIYSNNHTTCLSLTNQFEACPPLPNKYN